MKRYHDIIGDGGSDVAGQVTEHAARMQARMASVRRTVAVMSGKGGVGKSSVTVNLAAALALKGWKAGIVDADLNGPSIALMTGVRGQMVRLGPGGVQPAVSEAGLKVMSMDLFLPGDDAPVLWDAPTQQDAYAWRGLMEAAALRELLSDTEWGSLDVLLVDLPPGTDKLPMLADVLPQLSGALAVTIPSAVSALVVGRSLSMARELLDTPVIGVVENMSTFICPHCGREEAVFTGGDAEQMAARFEAPFLGRIPFDPRIAALGDEGVPFATQYRETPAGRAFSAVAGSLAAYLDRQSVPILNPRE